MSLKSYSQLQMMLDILYRGVHNLSWRVYHCDLTPVNTLHVCLSVIFFTKKKNNSPQKTDHKSQILLLELVLKYFNTYWQGFIWEWLVRNSAGSSTCFHLKTYRQWVWYGESTLEEWMNGERDKQQMDK